MNSSPVIKRNVHQRARNACWQYLVDRTNFVRRSCLGSSEEKKRMEYLDFFVLLLQIHFKGISPATLNTES